jgi:hypothetical protein
MNSVTHLSDNACGVTMDAFEDGACAGSTRVCAARAGCCAPVQFLMIDAFAYTLFAGALDVRRAPDMPPSNGTPVFDSDGRKIAEWQNGEQIVVYGGGTLQALMELHTRTVIPSKQRHQTRQMQASPRQSSPPRRRVRSYSGVG